MKKRLIFIVVFALLFSNLFAMSPRALTIQTFRSYFRSIGGSYYNPNDKNLGSVAYWDEQIEKGKWTGENRPKPLMGDANIDGKVDAKDALFALCFSLYGNIQTDTLTSGVKTPYQMTWASPLNNAYYNNQLEKRANSIEHWRTYCVFNSPFFADVTKDCVVNAKDALEILKYSVGKARDFPVGDFTSVTERFSYYPWPTEYYPGFFQDHLVDMTDEEFCEKYNFESTVTAADL